MFVNISKEVYSRFLSRKIDREINKSGSYWLFILGVNNSGTTILSNLVETHPEIRTLPAEGQQLTSAFPRPDILGVGRLWSSRMDVFRWSENNSTIPALVAKKDWLKLYSKNSGILLEKSPPNTVRSLWLQKNFNPSKFLSIVRCPYAVCEGIKRRKNYSITQAALHWTTANQCMLSDMSFLKHNLLIKYEDLVQDPVTTLNQVQHFLGLKSPFNHDACAQVAAHSMEGTTTGLKNMNHASHLRLSQNEIQEINNICGQLMNQLGYEKVASTC
jgi:hypothetical protein